MYQINTVRLIQSNTIDIALRYDSSLTLLVPHSQVDAGTNIIRFLQMALFLTYHTVASRRSLDSIVVIHANMMGG